jgi:hypothetical protein
MHLVGYLYEDYHDARSLEHKVPHISQKEHLCLLYECQKTAIIFLLIF